MSPSRVFFDTDVPTTREYLTWLATQETTLATVDASQVTKVETLTISEIIQFLKTETAQKATFNCIATIDNIKPEHGWYYIGCTGCNTKVTKGPSTLVCYKCNNANAMGVILFRLEYSVHDEETKATFVFLDEYIEANGESVEGQEVPPPDCLSEVLSQTHKLEVKVSEYNFHASRQTITVTKLLKPEDGGVSETDSVDAAGESNSNEQDVKSSSSIEDTTGSVSANNTGEGLEETTKPNSKRPRLNT